MKKTTKVDAAARIVQELLARDGMVRCPLCSKPNWDVFHKPEQCPEMKPAGQS